MPKKVIDYSKSIIYTISNGYYIYVGSTTQFTKRKNHHKTCCNNPKDKEYNLKVYELIRANGGWEAFEMKPHKIFPCQSKLELEIEEENCRKIIQSTMNTNWCHRNPNESKKAYYEKNRDKLIEQRQNYINDNPEVKEERLMKSMEYYYENKEKIAKRNGEKVKCECGCEVRRDSLIRHRKSNAHKIIST